MPIPDVRPRPGQPSEDCGNDDPEQIAIREALALGKAVHDRRVALGLTVPELALRVGMTSDEIECIEEGGAQLTIALLRTLSAALGAGGDPGRRPNLTSATIWP